MEPSSPSIDFCSIFWHSVPIFVAFCTTAFANYLAEIKAGLLPSGVDAVSWRLVALSAFVVLCSAVYLLRHRFFQVSMSFSTQESSTSGNLSHSLASMSASDAGDIMFARQLLEAHEIERHKLARDLHDDFGQALTFISFELQSMALRPAAGDETTRERLAALQLFVDGIASRLHDLAWDMRLPALEALGIRACTEDLVRTWADRLNIVAATSLNELSSHGRERDMAVYRFVQEALTNVTKHSGALSVCVTARLLNGRLRITVEDDGRGFDELLPVPVEHVHTLGLTGMRERLALVGGALLTETAGGGGGATLHADIPVQKDGG